MIVTVEPNDVGRGMSYQRQVRRVVEKFSARQFPNFHSANFFQLARIAAPFLFAERPYHLISHSHYALDLTVYCFARVAFLLRMAVVAVSDC